VGGSIKIEFGLTNALKRAQDVMVDFQIHYVKANGTTAAKVFKLKALTLAAGETAHLQKTVSLREMTTRKHYPGLHEVEILLNGVPLPLGAFSLEK
jgi:hypothetical protein